MGRSLLDVVTPSGAGLFALPSSGVVRLGSAPEADILLSGCEPTHLQFDVEQRVLTVLGDGVRVGSEWVSEKSQVRVEPGELITVRSNQVVFITWQQTDLRRVSSHDYFDQRLTEECQRAARRKMSFSLANVRLRPRVASEEVEPLLASAIRLTDVLGMYARGVYEVLLLDTEPADAESVTERLRRVLRQFDVENSVGVAHFPFDGSTADELGDSAAKRAIGALGQDLAEDSPLGITVLGNDDLVDRVAKSGLNVLIMGETGSGKEVLAARLHQLSPRAHKPFLKLNCAAFTEALLESELFGHEKGSFTGAHTQKAGLLEIAHGGSVLLDEIGELSLAMQSKLLRVLEDRTVLRVGGLKSRAIDVRFIAATNRDLEVEVNRGRFRADLYFRLDGSTLVVPPLRDRMDEFDKLAHSLVDEAARRLSRATVPRLTESALGMLKRYHWPGNVRELRNVLERAIMMADGEEITRRHLPIEKLIGRFTALGSVRPEGPKNPRPASGELGGGPRVTPPAPTSAPPVAPVSRAEAFPAPTPSSSAVMPRPSASGRKRRGLSLLAPPQEEAERWARERQQIETALKATAGNQTRAAEVLGISRRTLINRLQAHGLPRPRSRDSDD